MNFLPPKNSHVIVGISGGVDSAIAALILKQLGYQVSGIFMHNWNEENSDECTARRDYADAKGVCQQIDIPLKKVNFVDEYWNEVFTDFLNEYKAGRTPNPDILCNRNIKFKHFLNHALSLNGDYIATGHYCRQYLAINKTVSLLKGKDANKDQSYFLHKVEPQALAKSCFPLGNLNKAQVRKIAQKHNLLNHAKKDSTGICFIGERKFKDFLADFLPTQQGEITDVNGNVLGTHQGLMFYTIGQRQGLGIGGNNSHHSSPWYVAYKDLTANKLVVVEGEDHPALLATELIVQDIHWINKVPSFPLQASAKIRYRQADQPCTVYKEVTGYKIIFDIPQRAITLGQSAVLYQQDICLGGGIITHTYNKFFNQGSTP
ncbi:tRNA 2-thiouridine(34) synthase MnmA [Gammaproteobacteria bacterium]|nr:tRNA 2-thiouridine(34) synthase MnmA [Gammaproteobacteria bacterium]